MADTTFDADFSAALATREFWYLFAESDFKPHSWSGFKTATFQKPNGEPIVMDMEMVSWLSALMIKAAKDKAFLKKVQSGLEKARTAAAGS